MHRGQERYAGVQKDLSKLYRTTGGKQHWGDYRSFQRSDAARSIWRNAGNAETTKESNLESRLHLVPQNNDQLQSQSTKRSNVLNRGQQRYASIQKELSTIYRATGGKNHWGDWKSFQRSDAAKDIWKRGHVETAKQPELQSNLQSVPKSIKRSPEAKKRSNVLNRGQERYAGIQKKLSMLYRSTGGKKHWGDYTSFQRSNAAKIIWREVNAKTSSQSDHESKPEPASENNHQRVPLILPISRPQQRIHNS